MLHTAREALDALSLSVHNHGARVGDVGAPTPAHPLLDRLWNTYEREVACACRFTTLAGGALEKTTSRCGRSRGRARHRLPVETTDGNVQTFPYAYFEIAERRDGFDGFLAPQARQLFEMTSR